MVGPDLDDALLLAGTRVDTDALRAALDHLRQSEPLDDLEPALDGAEVMAVLGIPQGADVGRALAFLRELRLTEGVLDRRDARRRLEEWWAVNKR